MSAAVDYKPRFDDEAVRRPRNALSGRPALEDPGHPMDSGKQEGARIVQWTPGPGHSHGRTAHPPDLEHLLSLLLEPFHSALDRADTERAKNRWSAVWPLIQRLFPPGESIDTPTMPIASLRGTEHPRLILRPQPTTQGTIVLDCAERYWNATGDPLGALLILKDLPEEGLTRTVAKPFAELAQEVADDLEREQLWDRVYPPGFPVNERWKENAAANVDMRVLPALLVDADKDRALLRVGEWLEGSGPASFEVVVRGNERELLRPLETGSFMVVTFDADDALVEAREQNRATSPTPPKLLLKELVRRWNCLTQSP